MAKEARLHRRDVVAGVCMAKEARDRRYEVVTHSCMEQVSLDSFDEEKKYFAGFWWHEHKNDRLPVAGT